MDPAEILSSNPNSNPKDQQIKDKSINRSVLASGPDESELLVSNQSKNLVHPQMFPEELTSFFSNHRDRDIKEFRIEGDVALFVKNSKQP